MKDYQHDFIDYAIAHDVLRFGDFRLKSGRQSPYFFNSGLFCSGQRLMRLGCWYADAIADAGVSFDMVYGPAYKGIPLVTALAIALAQRDGRDVPYSFNRKEAKDHGEGGIIVGAPLTGRVLIVDDVISAGTSCRESVDIIRAAGARPVAIAISLDRQERGTGNTSAVQEVERTLDLRVVSIATLDHLLEFVAERGELAQAAERVRAYRARYGI
ncbi:MAG: orotate phosphoribosyltransferase [Gammaproteobacteria bacterium]